jgi:uncharacterized membrane protein YfcA
VPRGVPLDPSPLELALLVAVALVAGGIDAIAGGGGLLTLPALLATGLPPHLALGTNKGQSVFGSGAALARFARAGLVDPRRALVSFPAGLAGSFAGAGLVLLVRPDVLRPLVLALLVAVALFLAFRPPVRERAAGPVHGASVLTAGIALAIGAYDGFFGPGTGTFLIVAFVLLLGDAMAGASANAKVVNFASNLAAVILFASRGLVIWRVAVPMAAAQLAGGWLGAHVAVRGGDRLVRRVVLGVVIALAAKLAADLLRG